MIEDEKYQAIAHRISWLCLMYCTVCDLKLGTFNTVSLLLFKCQYYKKLANEIFCTLCHILLTT